MANSLQENSFFISGLAT